MVFEIYIQEQLTIELWQKFVKKIIKHIGVIDVATIDIHLGADHIAFFVHANKDLSILSRELQPFILKREQATPQLKYQGKKRCWFRLYDHYDLTSLNEHEHFEHGRTLRRVLITIKKRLVYTHYKTTFCLLDDHQTLFVCRKSTRHFPFHLLNIDFAKVINYKKKSLPIYVKLDKVMNLFSKNCNEGFLEVNSFPYLNTATYLPLKAFNFSRHSLIVGQTGTGKSKFLESYVKQLYKHNLFEEYTVVVIDPHASLYADFLTLPNNVNIDFHKASCQLFSSIGEPKVATELTILLFQTLMKDQFNPKMERVLKYCLFVLFQTNRMSLEALRQMLTDIGYRKELLLTPGISEGILQFFDTDFVEMETKFYELGIMPILVLLDELTFLPMSNFQESESLGTIVNNHSLVFLSLDKILLGDKATKLVAGLLIQQLFLLAQARAFKKKIIFIIDEVSVVQNAALATILSEARKFNLSLFVAQQYLGQVEENLLKSIITNIYNYFIFKISEDDAKLLVNNLEFEFSQEQLAYAKEHKGLSEEALRTRMITTLNPRECIARVYHEDKFYPVFKAKTMNI